MNLSNDKSPLISDNIITNIAALMALGVAFFPTVALKSGCPTCDSSNTTAVICETHFAWVYKFLSVKVTGYIHLGCAVMFFLLLAVISYFYFTRRNKDIIDIQRIKHKNTRNIIYRLCGIGIVLNLIIMFILCLTTSKDEQMYIFWPESFCLFLFGLSWLVKGKVEQRFKNLSFSTKKN